MPDIKKSPFEGKEEKVWELIIEAHNAFCGLEQGNRDDAVKWAKAIHDLQDVMIYRLVKKAYPDYFN